jgi:hypothetical protein
MKQPFQAVSAGSSNKNYYTIYMVKMMRLMKFARKITVLMMLALVIIPSFELVMAAASLKVGTDSDSYTSGEDVEISGTAISNANVTIVVFANRTLEIIYEEIIEADEDGEFSVRIQLFEETPEGTYNVTASVDDDVAETYFVVVDEDRGDNEPEELEPSLEEEEPEADEEELGGGSETVEEMAENAIGLRCAIERAYSFIEKIRASADRLGERGYDVYDIEENISEAEIHLENALALLESFDINGSAREHAEARGILGRTMGLLQSMTRKNTENRVLVFIEQAQNRINGLDNAIAKLTERVDAAKSDKARNALSAAEAKLRQIKNRLTIGDVDDLVGELNVVAENIDEGLDELNGDGISSMLKAMNRIRARIRVLNATAKRLVAKGENVSRIEAELESAEAIMRSLMDLLSTNKLEEAEGLLAEAQEYLEETGRKISDIVSPSWIQKRSPSSTGDNGSRGSQKPNKSAEGTE